MPTVHLYNDITLKFLKQEISSIVTLSTGSNKGLPQEINLKYLLELLRAMLVIFTRHALFSFFLGNNEILS